MIKKILKRIGDMPLSWFVIVTAIIYVIGMVVLDIESFMIGV